MPDFVYPTSAELLLIERDKMPRLTEQRPIFDILPTRDVDNFLVMWEQRDNYVGLQQLRGLNGAPPKVSKLGAKRFQYQPGVYGEWTPIDEIELTTRRQFGTFSTPVSIDDLVMDEQDKLLQRRLDRIENIGWTLLFNGTFAVPSVSGAIAHTDSYSVQTYTASSSWANFALSSPLLDLRSVQLLGRGHSVVLDSSCKLYINRRTANNMFANLNNADLYGRRTAGLGTFNSQAQINDLLLGDDLPQIEVYEEGYLQESTGVVTAIPVGSGGAGYTSPPQVVISGGGGSGAYATSVISGGVVTAINIQSGGYNFTSAPTVTLVGGGFSTAATIGTVTIATQTGIFTPFVADNVGLVIGKRPAGQNVGEFFMTRNVNNTGMAPGPYQRVIDRGEDTIPRSIEVHDGWNGGPVIYYPSAVVKMNL